MSKQTIELLDRIDAIAEQQEHTFIDADDVESLDNMCMYDSDLL